MLRLTVIAAVLMSACGSDRAIIPLPDLASTIQSWLVARVSAEGQVRVDATDLSDPAIEFAVSENIVDLEVRGFQAPLAINDLALGPVAAAIPGQPSEPLPMPDVSFRAHLEGASAAPWVMGGLDAVDEFRRARATPCVTFGSIPGSLGLVGNATWVHQIDARTHLVGGANYSAVTIDDTGMVVEVTSTPTTAKYRAGFSAGSDVWLGDEDGSLWRATYAGALSAERVVQRDMITGGIYGVGGDPAGSELYVMGTRGVVARVRGDRYEEIARFDPSGDVDDFAYRILWLGPDEILFARSNSSVVSHWKSGAIAEARLFEEIAGVVALAQLPDGRRLAGMTSGHIAIFGGGEWTLLPPPAITLDIRAFYAFGEGFFYAGSFGYVGQWDPSFGYCPVTEPPIAGNTVKFIRKLGDKLLMVGNARRAAAITPFALITY